MPRRTSARNAAPRAPSPTFSFSAPPVSPELQELRRQWKWAAFSQFFFTFNSMFALNDVTLTDIEDDLIHSTNLVLPRVMHRLLVTLTQDRKISLNTWQTALRKQYNKRDPQGNPIGPIAVDSAPHFPQSSRTSAAPDLDPNGVEDEEKDLKGKEEPSDQEHDADEGKRDPEDVKEEDTVNLHSDDPPPDEQKDWLDLPMFMKLESMHTLVEWQFQNPNRLRTLMKDDDETAQWRIEPIGYDAKRNAYWLIGADRLWIQREPPRENLKRKRGGKSKIKTSTVTSKRKTQQAQKRQRLDSEPDEDEAVPAESNARSTRQGRQPRPTPTGGRSSRAAKARANQKLDAQAKDLAEFQKQMSNQNLKQNDSSGPAYNPKKSLGTRISARLRGATSQDGWQEIPQEWLAGDSPAQGARSKKATSGGSADKKLKTGLESDADLSSDLTELSEDSDDASGSEVGSEDVTPEQEQMHTVKVQPETSDDEEADSVVQCALEGYPEVPSDFVEWETICVTLQEWDTISDRFEKASHYAEKALYKTLAYNIVPLISAELRDVERKQQLEEAVVHRKRSSRIALKESEKEEARLSAKRKADEEEKLSRARRLEARLQKEEVDRQRRENAREHRRLEREQRENEQKEKEQGEQERQAASTNGRPKQMASGRVELEMVTLTPSQGTPRISGPSNASGSGSRTPMGEEWELDCEICHRRGTNQDDGTPMMSCGLCSKWQHILCHNKADMRAGRQLRNWDKEDFICQRCWLASKALMQNQQTPYQQIPPQPQSRLVGHQPYYHQGYNDHNRGYGNTGRYGDTYQNGGINHEHQQQSDIRTPIVPVARSVPQSAPVTFSHYQPHQHGFSTIHPTHTPPNDSLQFSSRYQQPSSSQRLGYPSEVHYPSYQAPCAQTNIAPSHEGWDNTYSRGYPSYGVPVPTPSQMHHPHLRLDNGQSINQYPEFPRSS